MIVVFDKNAKTWQGIGEGTLNPSSCIVAEELNGAYELKMTHPYDDGGKWKRLENQQIIYADTPDGKQPFRIYQVVPNMDGVAVNARHIFYDLLDNLVLKMAVAGSANGALREMKENFVYPMDFTFSSNLPDMKTFKAENRNPISIMLDTSDNTESILNTFGGELKRNGLSVAINSAIGTASNVRIAYGKNLLGLEVTEDIAGIATRVYPIGKDGLTLPEKFVDSPRILSYVNPKIYVLEDSQIETEAELRAAAQAVFASGGDLPQVNIKVDFEILSKTDEYKDFKTLEQVYLGDTVTVVNQKMGFYKAAKVISYEWDSLLNRYNSIELGDFLPTLVSPVTSALNSGALAASANANIDAHITDFNNPHRVTTEQIGAESAGAAAKIKVELQKQIDANKIQITTVSGKIGDLNQLKTSAKTNLVLAVNEINGRLGIKTYTSLAQMGIADSALSPDDFALNMDKMTTSIKTPFIAFLPLNGNFGKSILNKMVADNIDIGGTTAEQNQSQVAIKRYTNGSNNPIKVEVEFDRVSVRENTYVSYVNRDGTTTMVYPFRRVAYTQICPPITPLNGWALHNEGIRVMKNGNYVSVNFILQGGTRSNSTTVFVLPGGFRPIGKSVSIPIFAVDEKVFGFLAIQPNGNANCHGLLGTTKNVFCSGGFPIA